MCDSLFSASKIEFPLVFRQGDTLVSLHQCEFMIIACPMFSYFIFSQSSAVLVAEHSAAGPGCWLMRRGFSWTFAEKLITVTFVLILPLPCA